jgi:hypothetical protein
MTNYNLNFTAECTYCAEDNKLRIYSGRVDREDYLALKKLGWTATPKQTCDFVATWSLNKEDQCLQISGGFIGDEEESPSERSAQRAERFLQYQENRINDYSTHAEKLNSLSMGYQSEAKAQSAERKATSYKNHALNNWSKAEYWSSRVQGVITHALHKVKSDVRRGRVLGYEKEVRALEKHIKEVQERKELVSLIVEKGNTQYAESFIDANWSLYNSFRESNCTHLEHLKNYLENPANWDLTRYERKIEHYNNLITYESEIIKAQGGNASEQELEVGGTITIKGKDVLITGISRSPVTKKITSIKLLEEYLENDFLHSVRGKNKVELDGRFFVEVSTNIKRSGELTSYKAPTPENLKVIEEIKSKQKSSKPKAVPLINPDSETLEHIQNKLNEYYSNLSSGVTSLQITSEKLKNINETSYRKAETVEIDKKGERVWSSYKGKTSEPAYRVRVWGRQVIQLMDKKQDSIKFECEEVPA